MQLLDLVFRTRTRDGFPVLGGALPLLGHMPYLYLRTRELYRRAEHEVGPLFWLHPTANEWLLACVHPDGLAMLRNKAATVDHYAEVASPLLGDSLLVHDGAKHQHERSAMNGPFTPRGLSAADVGPVIADTISARVQRLVARDTIRILAETRELALDVIFGMMGIPARDLPAWRHHYEEYILSGIALPIDALPGSPRWRARRAQRWLDAKLTDAIHEARRDPEAKGMLAHLARSRDEDGAPLSDREILENIRLVALAGHETTATTMAWMVIELSQDPARWQRLVEEARAADDLPRTPPDLARFPFAEALFREALRLHPPVVGVSRRVAAPLSLAGRSIPAGTTVGVVIERLARNASLYPDPDQFLPERWLGRREAISAMDLAQFGGGAHFCLGYHVAWMESVIFIVALARALGGRGLMPLLSAPFPSTRFMPLAHPDPSTQVRYAKA
jgi:cytochrome P450